MFKGLSLLYPVVGTGAFFVMFWLGAVLAHDFGASVMVVALCGLISGLAGAVLVAEVERRDCK